MNNTDKDKSQRQIELLQVLAEGCRELCPKVGDGMIRRRFEVA